MDGYNQYTIRNNADFLNRGQLRICLYLIICYDVVL